MIKFENSLSPVHFNLKKGCAARVKMVNFCFFKEWVMTRFVIGVRCAVLGVAVLLALPLSGDVFEVRGGSSGDVGECTTTIIKGEKCANKTSEVCGDKKNQCLGCVAGNSGSKSSMCKETDAGACPGDGCTLGQKHSELSGASCVVQECPGGGT